MSRETSSFGQGLIDVGVHKWSGGILAANGCIYAVPWTHAKVLVIDPRTCTVSFLETADDEDDDVASLSEHKWRDCVLADDGRIFCVPWTAQVVLCIDPAAGCATSFGNLPEGESKWAGAAMASDGNIYCAPYDARGLLASIGPPNTIYRTTSFTTAPPRLSTWPLLFYSVLSQLLYLHTYYHVT